MSKKKMVSLETYKKQLVDICPQMAEAIRRADRRADDCREFQRQVGRYLKRFRKASGMTRKTLAKYSGLSRDVIVKMERGRDDISLEMIFYYMLWFDMTPVLHATVRHDD